MNKHELKSLLENIYTALKEDWTPEHPEGEVIPNRSNNDSKDWQPIDPNSWDPSIPHWFRRLAEIMRNLQKPQ